MGKNVTVMGSDKKELRKELKKHAATIHCSNTLSLLQRKITNALLFHAYKELMVKEEHEITVRDLCRLIGYQGHNHAVIKDALRGLISTVIEWNLINDETQTENWTASSILASVSLEGPVCFYAYSPRMKQLLHSPSIFGKIDLIIQSKFRSSYGLALYENCIRYRGLPRTKWFDMLLFKKLMGVLPGKYDIFRDFKRRVLDKAIDEVNTYSDLIIAAELLREGRKAAKIRFTLKERPKRTRLGLTKDLVEPKHVLANKLESVFHLSKQQINALLTEYETPYINAKIAFVEASSTYQSGKIKNLTGYLLSSIKNDYKTLANVTLTSNQPDDLADLKRLVESIVADYQGYREKHIQEALDQLMTSEKQSFMDAFFQYAEPVISTILQLQRNKYSRDNILESPQMKALLRRFAVRELAYLPLISLDEFVMQQSHEKITAWQRLKSFDPDHPLLHCVNESTPL